MHGGDSCGRDDAGGRDGGNVLFRFRGALDHPIAGRGDLLQKRPQGRAQVLGVAEMGAHTGAQLGLVNEFVGVGAVLEGRLGAEQEGIHVGRGTALHQLTREGELVGEQLESEKGALSPIVIQWAREEAENDRAFSVIDDVTASRDLIKKSKRLSKAVLETLAIIAYKQPLSRAQIASIRGVDPDGVIRTAAAFSMRSSETKPPGRGVMPPQPLVQPSPAQAGTRARPSSQGYRSLDRTISQYLSSRGLDCSPAHLERASSVTRATTLQKKDLRRLAVCDRRPQGSML